MASVHPLALLEAAAESLATAVLPSGYATERGQDDGTKTANAVRVIADNLQAETEPFGAGNWRAMLKVVVHTNAHDSTHAAHVLAVKAVFDAFIVDDLAAQLTAAVTGFTVQGVTFEGGSEMRTAESWEDEIDVACRHICNVDL